MMTFSEWIATLTPAQKDAWDLDEATVAKIEDRFYFREICDDEKMVRFFQRTLDTVRDRYRAILRVETIKFDPLVSKYFEGEFTVNGTKSGEAQKTTSGVNIRQKNQTENEIYQDYTNNEYQGEKSNSADGSSRDTKQTEGTIDDTREYNSTARNTTSGTTNNQNTSQTINHSLEETENNSSSDQINHRAVKQAPMNASGVVIGQDGKLSNLDFDYASMYEQNDQGSSSHDEGTDEVNSTSTTTGSGGTNSNSTGNTATTGREGYDSHSIEDESKWNTYHDEGGENFHDNRHIDNNGLKNKTIGGSDQLTTNGRDVSSNSGSEYQIRHDRYTGRDDVLPQDALKAAMNYLQNYSTAFEWLCNKLEINFIGIYDI